MENSQAKTTASGSQGGTARYRDLIHALFDRHSRTYGTASRDLRRLAELAADCDRHGYPDLGSILKCALRGFADHQIAQIAVAVLIAEDLRS